MFAVVLIILALIGGSAGTYYIMESPRRLAKRRLAAIQQDRLDLDADRAEFEREAQRLEERKRQLAVAVAACNQRVGVLTNREQEFGRRVIAYDELVAENGIFRTDLRNAVIHAAYLEQLQHTNQSGTSTIAMQRNRLGQAYFDEVVQAARKSLTPSTYPTVKQRVRVAAERIRSEGADLPPATEERVLAGLHEQFERAVRASVEREEQARLREQIREEQIRQREADEAVEQAERERAAIQATLDRVLADVAGKHAAEVEELRARLAEAEAKSRRAISEAQLTKVGHVYVISNIGSFGLGVFKIGMTRRLEPLDRVYELGGASVPFPFDIHMMIKCSDAPALEAALHRHFHDRRVNRVNPRKEFFRVTIEEIVAAVRAHHGEIEYIADAEALEYKNSQAATDADMEEIDEAYSEAETSFPTSMNE